MKMRSLVPVSALALFTPLPLLAGESIDEEVVVTASHLPVIQSKSANAITVIDKSAIQNMAPLAASDLLRNVPGLAVSRSGVMGSVTQIRARGAEANHLLVLIDGVEANDPSQGDEVNWGTLTAVDIERIEVIRGPQSALYGSDAVAGVVNIITESAQSPLDVSLFSEAGSFDTVQFGGSLGHKGDSYDVRIGISDVDSNGSNISRHGGEDDGYRNRTYSLKGGWAATDNLKLSVASRLQDGKSEYDSVDFLTTGLPEDADVYSKFHNRTSRIQADYLALDGAWHHRLSYAPGENNNRSYDSGVKTGRTSSKKEQFQYLTSFQWSEDSQILSLLLEKEQEDFKQRGPISDFGDDPNQDLSRDTNSAGLEYRGTFREVLTLAGSVRFDDNSDFHDDTTYKLEASYAWSPATRLRATWGTAVKNPTFTELYGFYASSPFFPFVGNPDLKPEKSESWELGVDQLMLDGKLQVSLTGFKAELKEEINGFYYDPELFATTAVNMPGHSKRQGVELSFDASLADNLKLSAAYTYTDSTYQDPETGNQINELRRPHNIASATLNWLALERLKLNLNVQYNGKQDDQYFPPWPQPSEIVNMDDYTLVNLNATYDVTGGFSVYVKVENLLDENYEEVYGFGTPGIGGYVGFRYHLAR